MHRARRAGLDWAQMHTLAAEVLEAQLYGSAPRAQGQPPASGL
jgi:hypothetical protein